MIIHVIDNHDQDTNIKFILEGVNERKGWTIHYICRIQALNIMLKRGRFGSVGNMKSEVRYGNVETEKGKSSHNMEFSMPLLEKQGAKVVEEDILLFTLITH